MRIVACIGKICSSLSLDDDLCFIDCSVGILSCRFCLLCAAGHTTSSHFFVRSGWFDFENHALVCFISYRGPMSRMIYFFLHFTRICNYDLIFSNFYGLFETLNISSIEFEIGRWSIQLNIFYLLIFPLYIRVFLQL